MIDFRDYDMQQHGSSKRIVETIDLPEHELAEIRTRLWQLRELGPKSTSTDEDAA